MFVSNFWGLCIVFANLDWTGPVLYFWATSLPGGSAHMNIRAHQWMIIITCVLWIETTNLMVEEYIRKRRWRSDAMRLGSIELIQTKLVVFRCRVVSIRYRSLNTLVICNTYMHNDLTHNVWTYTYGHNATELILYIAQQDRSELP